MQGKTLKKICALICGVVLCGSAIPCLSASAETTSGGYQQETYYEYKPGNPNPVKEYNLDTRPPAIATISDDGDDDERPLLTPLDQKIVNIGYNTTGSIISDNAILVCAHTFFPRGRNFEEPSGVQIVNSNVSQTDDENSVKKLVVTGYHLPKKFVENPTLNTYDYAIITAKIDNGDGTYSDLSDYGHFDMGIPLESLENKPGAFKTIRLCGFYYKGMGKNPEGQEFTKAWLKESIGEITDIESLQINYNALSAGGTSGAPIYMDKNYNGQHFQTLIGIHTGPGFGVKVNQMLLKFALSNPNVDDDFN